MRHRFYLFLLAALCITTHMQAQVEEQADKPTPRYLITQKKYTVAFQPFEWFNWGLRFDFEMRLKDGPGWLQFGPTLYWITKGERTPYYHYNGMKYYDSNIFSIREPFSKMKGSGLDVNYKRFLDKWRCFYAAAGLSYNYFSIDYYGGLGTWSDYLEDDIPYHEYRYTLGTHTQNINRLGINYYLGYQIPSRHAFIFDAFLGISYRHSFSEREKPPFNEYPYSYGYTGFVMMTGIRVGIGIK